MFKLFVFSVLSLLLVGCYAQHLPAPNHCKACYNLVSFGKNLTSYQSEEQLRTSLIEWCEDSGNNANHGVCNYLVNHLMSALTRFTWDTFCTRVKACPLQREELSIVSNPLASKENITCDFCMNTMAHIKGIVASKETEDEFKLLLSNVCNYFGSFRNECITMLDQNLDDIFDYLRKVLDPNAFCKEMGYCVTLAKSNSAPEIEEVLNLYPVNKLDEPIKIDWRDAHFKAIAKPWLPSITFGPECFICKKIFTYVYDYINKTEEKTDEVIIEALDKVCGEVFTKGREKCERIVNESVSNIIYYVKMATEPDIACTLLGYCLGRVQLKAAINPHCDLCKEIMKWVYNELKDNRTQEAIRNALDRVCDEIMPASKVNKCKEFVDTHIEQIIDTILVTTNPDEACVMLGFCPSKQAKPKAVLNSIDCLVCQKIMTWVYTELKDNRTEEAIKNALDRVCKSILPKSKVHGCIDFINSHMEELIEQIEEGLTPKEACVLLKYCGQRQHVFHETVIPFVKLTKANKVNGYPFEGAVCDVCREVFTWINNRVSDPKVKEDVIAALDEVCQALPKDKRQECVAFVEKYANEIIEVISNETNPDVACSVMHLCKFNKNENRVNKEIENTPIKARKPSLRSEFCYVCQLTSHFIQEELYNYKTEEEINEFIEKELCNRLAVAVERETCISYVKEYGANIEQLIAQKIFDPTMICEHILKICPKNRNKNPKLEFELVKPSKEKVCQVCMKAVNRLDEITATVDWKPLDKNISLIATTACKVLPEEDIAECKKIIETYGLSFLKTNNLMDSRQVCHSVDICYMNGRMHILGGHKCTFGPSYWCHTFAHADACKATDYCKQKYWTAMQ